MKNIVLRRKQIRILLIILLVLVLIWCMDASGMLAKQLKVFLEDKLSKKLHAIVKIHSVEGGIVRGLILKNFEVYTQKEQKEILVLSVRRASIDYRLWYAFGDFLSQGRKKYYVKNVYLYSPSIYIERLLDLEKVSGGGGIDKKSYRNGSAVKTKGLLGGFAEDLQIYIHSGNIFFYGVKPTVENFSGEFILGNDWFKGNTTKAMIRNIPAEFSCRFYNFFDNPRFDLQFSSQFLDLFLNINGIPADFDIFGMVNLFNRDRVYFLGEAGFSDNIFKLRRLAVGNGYVASGSYDVQKKEIRLETEFSGKKIIDLSSSLYSMFEHRTKIVLQDVAVDKFKVSAGIDIKTLFLLSREEKDFNISGQIAARDLIINDKPGYKIDLDYEINKDNFKIRNFSLADGRYICAGWIKFVEPYSLDLEITLKDGLLADFWVLGKDESGREVKGSINGKLKLWGALDALKLKGHLEGKDGDLENFKYESAYAVVEGEGKVIKIIDGLLQTKEKDYVLGGQIDLRLIGTPDIIRQLKLRPVLADGKKGKNLDAEDTSQLIFGSDINKRVHIDYKMPGENETRYEEKTESELEVKYKLKHDQTLEMRLKEKDNEGKIELEHKIKF